jgi:GR25 family glycosyltransferase involved in LPS biosynthesis
VSESKIERIEAFHTPLNGHIGCCISHMKALDFAIEHKLKNVLILEDDVVFEHSYEIICQYIDTFFQLIENWDVFFLSTRVLAKVTTDHEDIFRVLCAQTAHSYAINQHYFKKLYQCYEDALKKIENDVFFKQSVNNSLDQRWKKLQKTDLWYIGRLPIARQGMSVSDIEHKLVDKFF